MAEDLTSLGIAIPQILLPRADLDPTRWAVIACDQYTSEPEYWQRVEQQVGDAPSTLRLIYPEVFLDEPQPQARIEAIRAAMRSYLDAGVLRQHEGMIYVERQIGARVRRGLMVALDLEAYDFSRGSRSLVRATEGTILDRLPPRIRIRQGAPIELPHIMVLIDDPEHRVIAPLAEATGEMKTLYDFELMLGGGHIAGYAVGPRQQAGIVAGLRALADADAFAARYELRPGSPVLLYAMGDGNHSLATAKAIWDEVRKDAPDPDALQGDPRRHALVELVNLHDESLVFEPIHRVLFGLSEGLDLRARLRAHFGERLRLEPVEDLAAVDAALAESTAQQQRFGLVSADGHAVATLRDPPANLPVGSLQAFIDELLGQGGFREVDYVHGSEAVSRLGRAPGNAGLLLPGMDKHDLFKTVIVDGALPRKTFSMGEADEKRFYLECRALEREAPEPALRLRPMTEADLPRKVKWANDEVVNRHIGFTERITLEGTRQWFAAQVADPDTILFTLARGDEAIGYVKLRRDAARNEGEYQGAAIGESRYWGRGLGKQMVRLLLRHVFEQEGWDRLWGYFPGWNERSIGLHEAMGFRKIGTADFRRLHPDEGKEYEVHILAFERADYPGPAAL